MFDLNKPPDEEDGGTLVQPTLYNEPFIGQTFSSLKEAHIFYQVYAIQHGYSVRRDRSDKRNNKSVRCVIGNRIISGKSLPGSFLRSRLHCLVGIVHFLQMLLDASIDLCPVGEFHVRPQIKLGLQSYTTKRRQS
nr:protein FAR1-related sequence 11 [Tanacetum cinerariifolium]